MHRLQDLVRLHRMGTGVREVARLLGMSPNTERQYRQALREAGLLEGKPEDLPDVAVLRLAIEDALPSKAMPQHASSVERWAERITEMLGGGATPTAIYDRLRLEHDDFGGSLSAVKRLCTRSRSTSTASSATATSEPRRSSPRTVPCPSGRRCSTTSCWPAPRWTDSSITRTSSKSPATPIATRRAVAERRRPDDLDSRLCGGSVQPSCVRRPRARFAAVPELSVRDQFSRTRTRSVHPSLDRNLDDASVSRWNCA